MKLTYEEFIVLKKKINKLRDEIDLKELNHKKCKTERRLVFLLKEIYHENKEYEFKEKK
jgi:hypothetical protein